MPLLRPNSDAWDMCVRWVDGWMDRWTIHQVLGSMYCPLVSGPHLCAYFTTAHTLPKFSHFLVPSQCPVSLSLSPVPLGTPFLPVLCQLVIKVWRNRKNREIGPALGRLEYDKTVLPQARGGWRKPGVRGGGKAS
jgi:hypothetical protein